MSNGAYKPIPATSGDYEDFSLSSDVLGIDLRLISPSAQSWMQLPSVAPLPREPRFYDPRTGTRLLNYEETEQARQEAEQARDEAEPARRNAAICLLQKDLSQRRSPSCWRCPWRSSWKWLIKCSVFTPQRLHTSAS